MWIFFQLWGMLQQSFNQEKLEEISVIFACIWSRRNKAVFEEKFDNPSKVVQTALFNLKVFQESDDDKGEQQNQVRRRRMETKWLPPTEDVTKINFDAAMNKAKQKMGI